MCLLPVLYICMCLHDSVSLVWIVFFFFKQKTAYEMRISDWSSDVCSSDLVDLGTMPLVDLTRFLACQLTDVESGMSLLFSTGLEMEGLPAERHAALLRRVIASKEAFFRYLRLLLSELDAPFAAARAAQAGPGDRKSVV